MKTWIFAGFALFALSAGASPPQPAPTATPSPGPHGGQVLSDGANKFEVKIDKKEKKVHVFTIHSAQEKLPETMSVKLYHDPETNQSIELRSLNLEDPLPHYEGELSPSAQSYMGFELSFQIQDGGVKVLPYVPYSPPLKNNE